MVTENYVSVETAKLLKEKGFDEMTELAYGLENGQVRADLPVSYWRNSEIGDYRFSCPTLQMAIKWLFEKKNCIVLPVPRMFDSDGVCYEWGFSLWVDDILEVDGEKTLSDDVYGTREEAENAGIEYCLENIIL